MANVNKCEYTNVVEFSLLVSIRDNILVQSVSNNTGYLVLCPFIIVLVYPCLNARMRILLFLKRRQDFFGVYLKFAES